MYSTSRTASSNSACPPSRPPNTCQATPYDQISAAIAKSTAEGNLPAGWKVDPNCSSQWFAVFVNEDTKEAYVAARGSSSLYSDWIANDFFGFFGMFGTRGLRTYDGVRDTVKDLKDQGFDVKGTGHSLGGSVMRHVCAALDITCVTFNAPFLLHDVFFGAHMRASNSGNVINVVMEGDVVSLISSPTNALDSQLQGNLTMTLAESMGTGWVAAHSMENIRKVLKGEKTNNICIFVSLLNSRILSQMPLDAKAEEGITLTIKESIKIDDGWILDPYETDINIFDGNGTLISTEKVISFQLGVHAQAATHAATQTLFAAAVNQATSAKGWDTEKFMDHAFKAGGMSAMTAYETSVATAGLTNLTGNADVARHFAGSGVRIANAVVFGQNIDFKKVYKSFYDV